MATLNHRDLLSLPRVRLAFNYFDPDKTGKIDAQKLKSALMPTKGDEPDEVFEEMIREAD